MLAGLISSVPQPAPAITFDPATASNVTLSGGNLTATNTGTTSGDQGARVKSAFGRSTGKLYFEVKGPKTPNNGEQVGCGVGLINTLYNDMGFASLDGAMILNFGGGFYDVWGSGSDSGNSVNFTDDNYNIMRVAVDLDARRVWFACANRFGTLWNGQSIGVQNPVGAVGGVIIPAGIMVPIVTYGGASGQTGIAFTLNVGATWFSSPIPTGFMAWCRS